MSYNPGRLGGYTMPRLLLRLRNQGGKMSDTGKVQCGGCKKVIKFPKAKAGKKGKCPGCGEPITLIDQTRKTQVTAPPKPPVKAVIAPTIEPLAQNYATDRNDVATVDRNAITPVQDSRISRFVSDGQPVKVVTKLLGRVDEICTDEEVPEYAAVQHLPGVLSPDAIVLTNRRVIIFRAKSLGRMNLVDVPWLKVSNIHIKEGIVGASIIVAAMDGRSETIDHLPKKQARCIYRVGQQREEEAIERRRSRKMEEERNAAGGVVVNAAIGQPAAPTPTSDLTSRLKQLKEMLDADLISQEEFDAKKAEMLSSL